MRQRILIRNPGITASKFGYAQLKHQSFESVPRDRFISLVGRDYRDRRFLSDDLATLPTLCRAIGSFTKHGPLLCHVNRAKSVRGHLPASEMGPHRNEGTDDGPSFRPRRGSGPALSRSSPAEAKARLSSTGHRAAVNEGQSKVERRAATGRQRCRQATTPPGIVSSRSRRGASRVKSLTARRPVDPAARLMSRPKPPQKGGSASTSPSCSAIRTTNSA